MSSHKQFDEEQLQLAACLSDQQLTRGCPLDFGHRIAFTITSKTSKSRLERMPLELATIIMSWTDIATVFTLRRTSKTLMGLVNNNPQYRQIYQRRPDTLRAILSVESGRNFTLGRLYRNLQRKTCLQCQTCTTKFDVLNGQRLCYSCVLRIQDPWNLIWELRWFPLHLDEACRLYKLDAEHLEGVSRFKPIRGGYGLHWDEWFLSMIAEDVDTIGPRAAPKSSLWLLDQKECHDRAVEVYGSHVCVDFNAWWLIRLNKVEPTMFPLAVDDGPPFQDSRNFMHMVEAPCLTAGTLHQEDSASVAS